MRLTLFCSELCHLYGASPGSRPHRVFTSIAGVSAQWKFPPSVPSLCLLNLSTGSTNSHFLVLYESYLVSLGLKRNQGNMLTIPGDEDSSTGEKLREVEAAQLPPCVCFKSRPHKTNQQSSYKWHKNNRCHIVGVLSRGEGRKRTFILC